MPLPIFRAQLRSTPANGHAAFLPHIRKLVFEFCNKWPSSANTRTFILNDLQSLARQNPHVEIVVRQRNQKEPIVRGFYGPFHAFTLCQSLTTECSQQPRQGHSPQLPRGHRHPQKSPPSARFIRCKDQTPQTSPRGEYYPGCERHMERSSCR